MLYILSAILLFFMTASHALRNGRIDIERSLSIHVSRSDKSILLARLTFSAISLLVLAWYFQDYVYIHRASVDVGVEMIVFALTILVQGLFPYNKNNAWDQIHNISAWTAAGIGPLLLLRFAMITEGPLHIFLLLTGILSCLPLIAFAVTPRAKQYFLPLQLGMIILSFASFLALSMN